MLFLLNMERPDSLFVADAFAIEPDDAIYGSNAPLTDVNKILEPILRSQLQSTRNIIVSSMRLS